MKSVSLILLVLVAGLVSGAVGAKIGCRGACITLYDPVCGKFGNELRTFSNDCFLERYNACNKTDFKVIYKGECKK